MKKNYIILLITSFSIFCRPVYFLDSQSVTENLNKQPLSLITNKKRALLINQLFKQADRTNLSKALLACNINITNFFIPEYELRGNVDIRERLISGKDNKTGIQIALLYGKNVDLCSINLKIVIYLYPEMGMPAIAFPFVEAGHA